MRRANFLDAAHQDLRTIFDYVAERSGSVSIAEAFIRRLRAKCHTLAALASTVGRPRPELGSEIRSVPFANYMIFFRYRKARFEVVNILESHRDVEAQFLERGED